MTWNARITRTDGTNPTQEGATAEDYAACQSCVHGGHYPPKCQVQNIANQVGTLLTCVDTMPDGHMAGGDALLKCAGYEPKD